MYLARLIHFISTTSEDLTFTLLVNHIFSYLAIVREREREREVALIVNLISCYMLANIVLFFSILIPVIFTSLCLYLDNNKFFALS
jgi:hypothetical protein